MDPIDEPVDIVIMSSATDRFHSCPDMVAGDPVVINALDITETGGGGQWGSFLICASYGEHST